MSKPVESFSQLTLDLRKRLDEEGIPWYDDSEIIGEHYVTIFERTKLGEKVDPTIFKVSIFYGWSQNEQGRIFSNSHGYPDKLECWCKDYDPEPQAMSIDEIIELAKSVKE